MAAKNIIVTLRVTPGQREQWRKEASQLGLTLSRWIQLRCNGVEFVQQKRKAA